MKIGKRNIYIFLKRILSIKNWEAIFRFKDIHVQPIKSIYQEVFSKGEYPRFVKFKSPVGMHEVKLYSSADFSTFNLIFCRQDYYTPKNFKIVVDVGSNIGLSAIYWLTRNFESNIYCYEPSKDNFEKLKLNLKMFNSRCYLFNKAVSNYNDFGYLNLEKTGVYTSLKVKSDYREYVGMEKCEVININDCLEHVLKTNNGIDILKIDNEGEELNTVSSIDKKFWKFIQCINVDGYNVRKHVPSNFKSAIVGSAQRFYKT